ncbi:hypothetical protein QV65_21025 [Rhodococcus erythropolis]|nr:hypothetical protein QV65_21025 [Rhodococcus erythropolis]
MVEIESMRRTRKRSASGMTFELRTTASSLLVELSRESCGTWDFAVAGSSTRTARTTENRRSPL